MLVLYNGRLGDEVPPEFHVMASEVDLFRSVLKGMVAYKDLWQVCVKGEKNTNGSFLALVVQTEERL